MRRLMLLRHGTPVGQGVSDLDRRLTPQGRAEAAWVGARLTNERLVPDLVLVSPARRARETWDAVRAHVGAAPARVEPRLYGASADGLLGLARAAGGGARALLMIGHNPGFADLAQRFAHAGGHDVQALLGRGFPPAGLAVIDFAVAEWREAAPHAGALVRFAIPRAPDLHGGSD